MQRVFHHKSWVSADKFVKLTNLGCKFINSHPLAAGVVFISLLPLVEYSENVINVNGMKQQIANYCGRTAGSVTVQISALKDFGALIPGGSRGVYHVNPFLAYRGDGADAIKLQKRMRLGKEWFNQHFYDWMLAIGHEVNGEG